MKKNKILFIIVILLVVVSVAGFYFVNEYNKKQKISAEKNLINEKITAIKNNYDVNVITTKDAKLYLKEGSFYENIGQVYADTKLTLAEVKINSDDDTYFNIVNTKYYINYKDIKKSDVKEVDDRYKKYIPFNENIITTGTTNFYNKDDKLIYSINESFDLPVIIKDKDKYFVEFNNELLYIKKDKNNELKPSNNNQNIETANQVSVLTYHFFFDETKNEKCDQIICLSKERFNEQMKYLKDNNFLALKMNELEMFLDKKINIPKKSVVVTIDDGTIGTNNGIEVINNNQINATLFIVTSWTKPTDYLASSYIDYHSHSDNLHQNYKCNTGGQGGLLMCVDRDKGIDDLKTSREKLDNTTVFCYPFYEYNSKAIEMLKEAGYTMAFAGGNRKIKLGDDKYKLSRYTITVNTSMDKFINIVN